MDDGDRNQLALLSSSVNDGSLGVITNASVSPRMIHLALNYTFCDGEESTLKTDAQD